MTDDSRWECQALNKVFQCYCCCCCCFFYVLQATWRSLWNANQKVPLKERPNYLHHLKRMVFVSSAEDVKKLYEASMADNTLVNCLTRNWRLEIKTPNPLLPRYVAVNEAKLCHKNQAESHDVTCRNCQRKGHRLAPCRSKTHSKICKNEEHKHETCPKRLLCTP